MYRHGTRNRYLHGPDEHGKPGRGCRCGRCRAANSAHQNRRRMAIDAGTHEFLVDAEPVRQHVLALKTAGLSYQRVAEIAGVSRLTVNTLLYGKSGRPPTRRMAKARAEAILAVRAVQLADGGWTPAVGTRRRLQALAVAGWPGRALASRLGISHRQFVAITTGRSERVTVETARQARSIYNELWMVNPAAAGVRAQSISSARKSAAAKGWASALAWDDDTIDDPAAEPDFGATTSRAAGLLENTEELLGQGYTLGQAAERLDVTEGYLRRLRAQDREDDAA